MEETLNKLNEELKEKDALIEKTEREIEFQGKKLNQMIKEEDSVNQEISDSEVQRERFLQEYHKRKSEFDSGKKYLPQLLSMQELAKSGISGIDGPLISVLEKNLSKDEIKKVTARAGEKISWMTAESESVALAAVKFLSAKNLPPLTFILTDSLPAESGGFVCKGAGALYERIIGFITAGTRIKDNIVYKSGCILRGGGEFPVRAGRLPGLEKEVQTVRKNLSERELFLERLRKKREGILKERRETESKLGQLKDRLSDLKQKKSNLKGRSEITGKEFKVIKEKIKEFSDKQELLLSAGKQESKIEGLSENLIKLKKEKNIMEDAIRELKISSAGLEAKINILSDSISRKLSRKRELKDSISQSEKEAERLKNLIKDLKAHRQNIISRNTEDIKELDSLKNKKKKEQAGTGELQNFKSRITSELKSLKAKQRDKELEIQRFKDMEAEEKQAEEILREKIKGIKVRLKEDMGRDLEQALKDYSRRAVSDDEIRDLKIKLERIGNVNLEAPEEFEKENQRFEFIKKHVDDLEEADRNLKNIIRKINNQTKDRFISSFNTINKNFNRVFNRLFEGGRAGLYLSEPDKILESGVEISAMPEGKKINSLKQLSGGEKALTAIALMFAVFEVKPSPFCILDEVDSPLDDVNLHRFLRMLRDYSEKTQFILITHNKQTMQESDTFYGITMEEFGVSKVISVNLKDVKSSSA